MDKEKLDRLQHKTVNLIEESMRVLKGGFSEARRLIHVTADATKLHIEKESRVLITHREYHRLGEEVYRAVKGDRGAGPLALNETMRDIIKRIAAAEEEISRSNSLLKHLSVVGAKKAKVAQAGGNGGAEDLETEEAPDAEEPEGTPKVPRKTARTKRKS